MSDEIGVFLSASAAGIIWRMALVQTCKQMIFSKNIFLLAA